MKILNNEQILNPLQHESKPKAQPPAGKDFGTILEESVKNTTTPAPAPKATTFINPLSGAQPASVFPSEPQLVANGIEDLINLLDRYCQKLADPRISLKQIDPVVRDMTRQMEKMAPALDSLSADEGLKKILNQTMVTASLELSKFYRGDYISV